MQLNQNTSIKEKHDWACIETDVLSFCVFECSAIEQCLKVRLTCLNVLGGFRLMTDVIRLLKCAMLNIFLHSLGKQLCGLLCILAELS